MKLGDVARLGLGVAVLGVVVCAVARGKHGDPWRRSAVTAGAEQWVVPRVARGPEVDGELDDDVWSTSLRSGPFKREDGNSARPHSEARLLWGEGQLFVGLYAADDDIQSRIVTADGPLWLSDAFQVTLRAGNETFRIDVSPRGTLTDARAIGDGPLDFSWSSGARLAADTDGTIDDSADRDEEWVIELAIPLAPLHLRGQPGEKIELSVRRCDELREGGRACGFWGSERSVMMLTLGEEQPLHRASVGRPQ